MVNYELRIIKNF